VIGNDLRVTSPDFFENTLPKITAKALNVGLVGHRDALAFVLLCILKGRNDDSLNTTTRVHFFLQRDLVYGSLFQETAGTAISAFCVLAKDDEINVAHVLVLQWSQTLMEETHWTEIDVEIETASHSQQNVFGVLVRRNSWIAEGSGKNRIEIPREHFERA